MTALLILFGLTCSGAALFDWDWFMNDRRVQPFVKRHGRARARLIYGAIGAVNLALAGVWFSGALRLEPPDRSEAAVEASAPPVETLQSIEVVAPEPEPPRPSFEERSRQMREEHEARAAEMRAQHARRVEERHAEHDRRVEQMRDDHRSLSEESDEERRARWEREKADMIRRRAERDRAAP